MIVENRLGVGEWCANESLSSEWWVTHRAGESCWRVFGPYETKEEAIEETGMPVPKTELEEVWEIAKDLREIARATIGLTADCPYRASLYTKAISARDRFDLMSRKYNKA